ncbi:hypothetical protein C0966_13945 [Bacillus methanolicus]|uniref:class I SAM-dependent methyltransferase n=1 Tax=Bacillus methanolicus TaxID=1471 RepID=UPI00238023FC|nr:class I SAM-dependent methyltransferase [Bacillus methanolicus]MDE3840435.1 hypothetical protein [Bacillus methanolicus]
MKLSNPEIKWLSEVYNKKDLLGQVFTPKDVAKLMVSLAISSKPETILEPCFGEGVFLEEIRNNADHMNNHVIGIEIDPELFNKVKGRFPDIELYNMDFFDFHGEVECVIMNPPYIRQELLKRDMPKFLNKDEILNRLPLTNCSISSRSNLYIYFFIKAWSILKDKGEIIAIVPNTWMAAEYGGSFKNFILSNFWVKSIIQFNKDVFPDADVDSCIIHLKKENYFENSDTHLINIKQSLSKEEIHSFDKLIKSNNEKLFVRKETNKVLNSESNWLSLFSESDLFDLKENLIPLKKLADLRRGLTTNYNQFFINDTLAYVNQYPDFFKEILCSPKDIKGYSTQNVVKKSYVFSTNKKENELPPEIKAYVKRYEREILNSGLPKTLYNKIISNPEKWFNISGLKVAPILFSYIVRERKKFILNQSEVIARDNFYEIYPKINVNKHVLFSILNSRITSLFMENIGRSHGKGLLKIQKYELEDLKIINPYKIQKNDLLLLENLGKELSNTLEENPIQIIAEIDKLLLPYVTTKCKVRDLEKLLETRLNTRLSKRVGHLELVNDGGV